VCFGIAPTSTSCSQLPCSLGYDAELPRVGRLQPPRRQHVITAWRHRRWMPTHNTTSTKGLGDGVRTRRGATRRPTRASAACATRGRTPQRCVARPHCLPTDHTWARDVSWHGEDTNKRDGSTSNKGKDTTKVRCSSTLSVIRPLTTPIRARQRRYFCAGPATLSPTFLVSLSPISLSPSPSPSPSSSLCLCPPLLPLLYVFSPLFSFLIP